MPPDQVAYYPAWETLPHERLSPQSDTVGRRLAVLRRLAHPVLHRAQPGLQRADVRGRLTTITKRPCFPGGASFSSVEKAWRKGR